MNSKSQINTPYMPNQTKSHNYFPIEVKNNSTLTQSSPLQPRHSCYRQEKQKVKEVDGLRKMNEQLREREEIYIDKLMKLEEGLEKQHSQFVKLQELYTELFESYKNKEIQVAEPKYRESERIKESQRSKQTERSERSNQKELRSEWEAEWKTRQKYWLVQQQEWGRKQQELIAINESLNQKLLVVNDNYQRIMQESTVLRNKTVNSRVTLCDRSMEDSKEYQLLAQEKQARIKYQYENQFLKQRNHDLETQRTQLEKIVAHKQRQLAKLREEKIKIHRQSSQKFLRLSPNRQTKRRVTFEESKEIQGEEGMQESNQQYFSFSGQVDNSSSEQLPTFPPQLEIDSIINQHRQ